MYWTYAQVYIFINLQGFDSNWYSLGYLQSRPLGNSLPLNSKFELASYLEISEFSIDYGYYKWPVAHLLSQKQRQNFLEPLSFGPKCILQQNEQYYNQASRHFRKKPQYVRISKCESPWQQQQKIFHFIMSYRWISLVQVGSLWYMKLMDC